MCVASCQGGLCPLIIGGHSSGGSIAVVASIDLRDYNPTVLTFGAPRAIVNLKSSPCQDATPENHFRFINLLDGNYDFVPNGIPSFNGKHIGYPLILDGLEDWPIAAPGLNDNLSRQPRALTLGGPHDRELYRTRIEALVSRECFPVPAGGWPEGHYCTDDSVCASHYCVKKACKVGL